MDWSSIFSQFGSGVPDLSQVSGMPGMGMGQLGTSTAGMTNLTDMMPVQQGPDFMKMLMAAGAQQQGQQPQQQQPMMQGGGPVHLQSGGGAYAMPYQQRQGYQQRPAAQALSGLFGGVYGNS